MYGIVLTLSDFSSPSLIFLPRAAKMAVTLLRFVERSDSSETPLGRSEAIIPLTPPCKFNLSCYVFILGLADQCLNISAHFIQ